MGLHPRRLLMTANASVSGAELAERPTRLCTMHFGTCGICWEERAVTDPREFGYLREDWKELHQNFRSPPSS